MNVEIRTIADLADTERDALAAEMSPHVGDAFGTFTPTPGMVRGAIDGNDLLHVVRDRAGALTASFMFRVIEDRDAAGPTRLLWLDRAGVSRAGQRRGLARDALVAHARRVDATHLGCTTQNPSLVSLFARMTTILWPMDEPYEGSVEGSALRDLARHATRDGGRAGDDGILRGLYGRRMGDYPDRPDLPAVTAMFERVGFRPEEGDAVLLLGRVGRDSR